MIATLSAPDYFSLARRAAERVGFPADTPPCELRPRAGHIDLILADGDREALAACGAALLNAQLALRAAGYAATADLLPDRSRPEVVASLSVRARCVPSAAERALAQAVPAAREHRGEVVANPVPPPVRTALVAAAAREECDLVPLEEPAEAAALERALHGAGWLAEVHNGPERLVAVLSSHTDTPRGQLRTGRALQRVLLTGWILGAEVAVLLHPEAAQKARPELRPFLRGQAHPQAVLELGHVPAKPSRRRTR